MSPFLGGGARAERIRRTRLLTDQKSDQRPNSVRPASDLEPSAQGVLIAVPLLQAVDAYIQPSKQATHCPHGIEAIGAEHSSFAPILERGSVLPEEGVVTSPDSKTVQNFGPETATVEEPIVLTHMHNPSVC